MIKQLYFNMNAGNKIALAIVIVIAVGAPFFFLSLHAHGQIGDARQQLLAQIGGGTEHCVDCGQADRTGRTVRASKAPITG